MPKSKYYHPDTDFYRKVLDQAAPKATAHGTEEDIREKLVTLKAHSWKMEGNKLTAQTEMGPLVQYIPTDYICAGTDDKGLPILTKVVI